MLVLSRKKDEKLMIGDNIEITIVDVKGETVKIGIDAPRDIKIYRGELLDAMREAATPPEVDLGALESKLKKKKESE
jgi:carbon storage regulator